MRNDTNVNRPSKWSGLFQSMGPGIMYAGAAIGVSHLVQSTRAGAGYGFDLIWVIVVVHVFKYPFFEFSHRYTAATGENLLVGYRRIGRWALIGYLVIALCLSVPSAAVLTIVTAGLASQMFTISLAPMTWAVLVLACCVVVLASGGYPLLDRLMKGMMALLAVCTLVAVAAAVGHGRVAPPEFAGPEIWNAAGITFLVALMGWMPTPVDAAAFPSVWMEERIRQTGHRPTLREALFDFRLGYVGSLVTAVMFLSLGALVVFGSGQTPAGNADDFAAQFITMYTHALGRWSRPVIMAAAFLTMLTTTWTVLDAYPRVLTAGLHVACPISQRLGKAPYWVLLALMAGGALFVYRYLTLHMRTLIDATTIVAFLSAPLFAYLNDRAVATAELPADAVPPRWLVRLSRAGLVFLAGFSLLFLIVRFG